MRRLLAALGLVLALAGSAEAGVWADIDASSVVTNIVQWDGTTAYPVAPGHRLIPYAPPAGVGSSWNGSVFSVPPVVAQVVDTTAQAATQADIATVKALIPTACPAVPLADTLLGTTGSGTPCTPRTDAARPTVVQAAIVTTDAAGNWSVTWAKPFASATPYINPQAINVLGQMPYTCNVSASTTTTASGKCWQAVTMTLPSVATSLLGLVLNPTGAAASIQVRVAAREPTQ